MSNIYIVEPPTNGKVLLKTTVGDIDLELWSKEAPKACRNFVQLCMEGYYNGTIFHRVVKGFIIQGGDPTGTGTGGDSIYGSPFKDEFHSRLRFARRGLLAMANAGKDDNASQFFFTLAATPELQNKHTIFGKVSGETIFNMLKLEDALVDHDERPMYPQKVVRTEVLYNPFPDIVPRTVPSTPELSGSLEKKRKKDKAAGRVKNFKLLSFGEEAEEDEEEVEVANKIYSGRSKSTHDVLQEPGLSSETAIGDVPDDFASKEETFDSEQMDRIRQKLKLKESSESKERREEDETEIDKVEEPYVLGQARLDERKKMAEDIRKEIRDLKRGLQSDTKKKQEEEEIAEKNKNKDKISHALHIQKYEEEQEKYKLLQSKLPKKGPAREDFTLALLAQFKQKLASAKEKSEGVEETLDEENSDEDDWLKHKLHFDLATPVLAKDASTKSDDWFDITDPRNPINKRRREDSKASSSSSSKRDKPNH